MIGASFIGLEAAAALRARGVDGHCRRARPVPLARVLGAEARRVREEVHEAKGVKFRLGTKPKAIHANKVELDDGSAAAGDFVVMGVGVRPRIELARARG